MTNEKGVEQIIDEKTPETFTELFTVIKVMGLGSNLIFQYVIGIAILLILTQPFESLPWIHDPIIRIIRKAAEYLNILVIMWAVLSAGQITNEVMICTVNWFSKLNKIVNKKETE